MEKQLLMLQGLPASGKTKYARELQLQGWKRVNKDDLRDMIDNGKFSRLNEKNIIEMRDITVIQYLDQGYNVVVDDTNFYPEHEQALREIAESCEAEFKVHYIDTPILECLKRNALRGDKMVPEKAVWDMYRRYVEPRIKKPRYDAELPDAFIFDIDGTLAKMKDRSPYDMTRVSEDSLNEHVAIILDALHNAGNQILIVSGRDQSCAQETAHWLASHSIHWDKLWMRGEGNRDKDVLVKGAIYEQNIKGKYNVLGVFDDRDQVVELWRSLGLTCCQVNYGAF